MERGFDGFARIDPRLSVMSAQIRVLFRFLFLPRVVRAVGAKSVIICG
jgi:hypothetical protein